MPAGLMQGKRPIPDQGREHLFLIPLLFFFATTVRQVVELFAPLFGVNGLNCEAGSDSFPQVSLVEKKATIPKARRLIHCDLD